MADRVHILVNDVSGNEQEITASNPLPIADVGHQSSNLQIYNKTMDTVGSFLPLTFTSQVTGFTIGTVANTTTSNPPSFDIANTSTGSPFFRIPPSSSYDESGLNLATNSVMYFSVLSQTNSTLQIFSKEID